MSATTELPGTCTWLDGKRAVVETPEEIDLVTAPTLRCALVDLLEEHRNLLVLDMANTTFMDSTGLGVIVGAIKRTRAAGGVVVLAAAPERILRVLRITGIVKVLPCFATLPEAFAYLERP